MTIGKLRYGSIIHDFMICWKVDRIALFVGFFGSIFPSLTPFIGLPFTYYITSILVDEAIMLMSNHDPRPLLHFVCDAYSAPSPQKTGSQLSLLARLQCFSCIATAISHFRLREQ
jgi:hypothetical protein